MELVTQCRMFCKEVSLYIGKKILCQYYCGTQKLLSLKEDKSLDKKCLTSPQGFLNVCQEANENRNAVIFALKH